MLTIYDKCARTRSLAWLRDEFGRVEIETPPQPEEPYYEIVELRENDGVPAGAAGAPRDAPTRDFGEPSGRASGRGLSPAAVEAPATITVTVLDDAGRPVPGIPVAWWWPDSPEAGEIGWGNHGVTGTTNEEGRVGHPMGGGACYDPRVAQGPHRVWIAGEGRSQMIAGLGIVAGTNSVPGQTASETPRATSSPAFRATGHRHMDVTFRETAPQPPSPQPGPDLGQLLLIAQQAQAMAQGATATLDSLIGQLMTHRCGGRP